MLENPFFHEEDAKMYRCVYRAKIMKALILLAVVGVVVMVTGCSKADVPVCQKADAMMIQTPRGPMVLFDLENMEKLGSRIQGLADGTCKLDPKEPEKTEGVGV